MKLNKMVIALAVALALLLTQAWALAESKITVQGVGAVKVDADRVNINLGVREIAEDAMSAQGAVNEKIDTVIEALKGMNVSKDAISTSGISLYPNYNYDDGETIIGYTAYNTIQIILTDVENTGSYIDAAFAAGANSLDYVEFSAAETEEASQRALTLAVSNAREKAQVLAEAAGLKLGAVLEIRDDGYSGYESDAMYAKKEDNAGMGGGTEVLASKQTVSATVSITFALEE